MTGKRSQILNGSPLARRSFTITAVASLYAVSARADAPVSARADQSIVVASKIDTEGALLGSLIAQTLRAHGLPVEERLQLGPTRILRQALLAGAIDIYPEYTGNGAQFFHRAGDPVWHDAPRAYATIRALDRAANDLIWLTPAPADNGWGIALRRDFAAAHYAADLADFAHLAAEPGALRLAASVEFVESADALPAFEHAYGFHLAQDQLLALAGGDTSATIRAAAEGLSGINAAMAYSSDGALDALNLVLLADPRHAQSVFQPAPVVRGAILRAHPEITAWLAPVFARLSLSALRRLNALITADGEAPEGVARHALATQQ